VGYAAKLEVVAQSHMRREEPAMSEGITFVGLDVHKESIAVAIVEGWSPHGPSFVIENRPEAVKRLAKRVRLGGGEVRACYEAGPCGYTLFRQLKALDVPCEVIAPSLIPKRPGDHVKTDRRDARQLATLYRAGLLTTVRVPTEKEEGLRDLARTRDVLRGQNVAAQHRLLKLLLRYGRTFAHGKNWTKAHVRWLRGQRFETGNTQLAFDEYLAHWDYLTQRQRTLETMLLQLAQEEPQQAAVARLCSLRGFSELRSILLLAEVVDFRRFVGPDSLAAFVGLVPGKDASADRNPRMPITKAGNSRARRILVEAAWSYARPPSIAQRLKRRLAGQPAKVVELSWTTQRRLHERYGYLVSRGKEPVVAVVAVARELCNVVWAMMNVADDV
jgi:transposase